MKVLGLLKYFWGIEVTQKSTGIFLCQRKYALDIIYEANMLGVKPIVFLLDQNHYLPLANGSPLSDLECYRKLVACLIYLSVTRLKLSYFVQVLA